MAEAFWGEVEDRQGLTDQQGPDIRAMVVGQYTTGQAGCGHPSAWRHCFGGGPAGILPSRDLASSKTGTPPLHMVNAPAMCSRSSPLIRGGSTPEAFLGTIARGERAPWCA